MTKIKFNWGTGILVFFTLFLTLAIVFIIFAINQNNDLIVDDYYEKGADFTTQVRINERSQSYNQLIQIEQENHQLKFLLKDKACEISKAELRFMRPSNKSEDRTLTAYNQDSSMTIPVSKLVKGRYVVTIAWGAEHQKYEVVKSLFIE